MPGDTSRSYLVDQARSFLEARNAFFVTRSTVGDTVIGNDIPAHEAIRDLIFDGCQLAWAGVRATVCHTDFWLACRRADIGFKVSYGDAPMVATLIDASIGGE